MKALILVMSLLSTIALGEDWQEVVKKVPTSPYVGQGNPEVSQHPMTPEQCRKNLKDKNIQLENRQFEKICGAKYMAPLYDPSKEKPEDAKVCMDQFEFPNQPCQYPVVWVRANEAAAICEAQGKRICDAHEWEGGCAGALLPPDYDFDLKGANASETIKKRRKAHNRKAGRNWAYGPALRKGVCAANSFKHAKCNGGNWKECGSNTYPAGAFPECKSQLEIYDQHGNAAEHMNLPLKPSELASTGDGSLGHTEMKGSWFIFDKYYAHQDWCRWRAPYWHGTKLRHPKSHHNYHLGFRCCKDTSAK